jgi:hypothetical protein
MNAHRTVAARPRSVPTTCETRRDGGNGVGSGNDTVDENSGDTGTDVIELVALNSSDILLSRSGNDLLIQINSSGETLKVLN